MSYHDSNVVSAAVDERYVIIPLMIVTVNCIWIPKIIHAAQLARPRMIGPNGGIGEVLQRLLAQKATARRIREQRRTSRPRPKLRGPGLCQVERLIRGV